MATNVRISGANPDSRQESDIRFNYNNLNEIICASTQLGGNQPMSFSTDGGATWSQASLPGVTGDARQGDPTIDWTSDGTAWTVTIGITPMNASFIMRTFKSVDQGATWTFDSDVGGGQTAMDKQALWVDHNASSPFKDNMYLIWHNGNPAFVSRRVGPNGTWSAPLQVSGSETTGTGIGLDIKTNQNGDVFAFWNDTGSRGLFVAKSTDGGVTFGTPVKIATTNGAFQVGVPAQNSRLVLIYPSGAALGHRDRGRRRRVLDGSGRRQRLRSRRATHRAATSTPTARPESSSRARPTAARRGDRRSNSATRLRRTIRSSSA